MRRLRTSQRVLLSLGLVWLFSVGSSCKELRSNSTTQSRIQYLRGVKKTNLPQLCSEKPSNQQQLVMFASQYCTHCHRMMDALQKERAKLKAMNIGLVVMWTDLPNCIKARMAGAHYPAWSYGRASAFEQQSWAVEATPVVYLLKQGRPVLRIDGACSEKKLLAVVKQALRQR